MGKMLRGNNKLTLNMATMCDILAERLQLELNDPTIVVDHVSLEMPSGATYFEIYLTEKDPNASA